MTTQAAEENTSPHSGEGFIGRDEHGRGEVPAGDDLEEEVGIAVVVVEVSDLVDGQKLRAGEASQTPGEGGVGVLGSEFVERPWVATPYARVNVPSRSRPARALGPSGGFWDSQAPRAAMGGTLGETVPAEKEGDAGGEARTVEVQDTAHGLDTSESAASGAEPLRWVRWVVRFAGAGGADVHCVVEVSPFDVAKLRDPEVEGSDYQRGRLYRANPSGGEGGVWFRTIFLS